MGRDLPGEGRDAAPLPPIEPVPGLALRPVAEADWRAIFEGLGEAFLDHFGHRDWSEADFEHLFRGPEVDTTLWRVAWDGDALAGASHNTISASECATLGVRQGWVDIIGVRRPWRGRGVARWLLAETMAEMARRGMERTILGVDLDNPTGALGLYESVGFLPLLRSTMWAKAIEPGTGGAPDGGAAG
jgi:mycothiol synthase